MRNGISSSDPAAIAKLEEVIDAGERFQAKIKARNKIARQKISDGAKILALRAEGMSETNAAELLKPDWSGRCGYPAYILTNNNANVRRLKARLEGLQERAAVSEAEGSTETEEKIGDVTLVQDRAGNRVRLFFPGKPDVSIRTKLKRNGFRWAPSIGAWQAYLSDYATGQAREIAGQAG